LTKELEPWRLTDDLRWIGVGPDSTSVDLSWDYAVDDSFLAAVLVTFSLGSVRLTSMGSGRSD
jgi:hypothetical protein